MQYVHFDPSSGLLLDLDPAYQRLIDDRSEGDHIVTGRTGGLSKLLDYRLIHGAGGRNDIQVGQYAGAVYADVERSGTGRAEESLCKMQPHCMAGTGVGARNRGGEGAPGPALGYGHG